MIGYNLITHQTTKTGLKVNAVLVHEGVEIEEVAKNNPSAVKVYPVDIQTGITDKILNQL
jgi:succinyl-CoA synthetase beta subunit